MLPLKRIRYHTMNSWNNSMAPAYNLKVHKVISPKYLDRVFELMDKEGFYDEINDMIHTFSFVHDYEWQAGFNGRSGGYLVLYRGDRRTARYTKKDFENANKMCYISDAHGWKTYDEAKALNLVDRDITVSIHTFPGRSIHDNEVPVEVLKSFRRLAVDIVKHVEWMAENCEVEEYEVITTKERISYAEN